jgi:membrane protein implicated in regulation of membrane protease activity
MTWWLWVLLGFLLMALELFTPMAFFFLFFGAGALVVGILTRLGLAGPGWMEWLLFSVVSVLALVVLRAPLLARTHGRASAPVVDGVVGEIAVPVEDLAPGAVGKVELRGTTWTAHNDGPITLPRGQRCRVTRVDGLTLGVVAE